MNGSAAGRKKDKGGGGGGEVEEEKLTRRQLLERFLTKSRGELLEEDGGRGGWVGG